MVGREETLWSQVAECGILLPMGLIGGVRGRTLWGNLEAKE